MGRWAVRVSLAAVALAAGAPGAAPGAVDGRRPNILLVTVDTFRPDHLGYYGYGRQTSPELDSLCAEGVFFRQAFTTSGWTAPGLVSLLTSLHAPQHGVDVRGKGIDPAVVTLAEALRGAGYRAPDIFFLSDIPEFRNLGLEPYAKRDQYVNQGEEILFRWLEEEGREGDRPFFLYYHYRDLHQPYNAGAEYEAPFLRQAFGSASNPLSWVRRFLAREKLDLVRREVLLPRGVIDFAPWDRGWVAALYDAQVRRLDTELFGRLRRVLREQGLADNTIVAVSADHGEGLLEHGLIGHVSTFREGRLDDEIIRIPLVLWAPGLLPPAVIVDDVVQCIDLMPTLLELVGAPAPDGASGRSLLPRILGRGPWAARPAFLETTAGGFGADVEQYARRTRAVRTERWKLIWRTPEDEVELYDLAADPEELEDLARRRPEVADSLRALLARWVDQNPRVSGPPPADPPPLGPAAAPQVLYPADGDTLGYASSGQAIQLRWTGAADGAYTIQYAVGQGAYHLEGELDVDSSTPRYGPFHADFWSSLVLYNPWRFRVYPRGNPAASSDWVEFRLEPAEAGSAATPGWVTALSAGATATAGDLDRLARGLALGLVDLGAWAARLPFTDLVGWGLVVCIAGALAWPHLRRVGHDRVRAWGLALAYIAVVYATVPVFPDVWARLREHTGDAARHLGTVLVIGLAAVLSARAWRQAAGPTRALQLSCLAPVWVAYGYLLAAFGRFPAERLHLIEYGAMAWVLFRALRIDLRPSLAYPLALLLTGLVGFGDEAIQWVLPQRFFELKDVGLNVVAGALGLVVTRLTAGAEVDRARR